MLSKIRMDGFDCPELLTKVCSAVTIEELRVHYNRLQGRIMRERVGRDPEWKPSELDCQRILQNYARDQTTKAMSAMWFRMAVGAVALVALSWAVRKL